MVEGGGCEFGFGGGFCSTSFGSRTYPLPHYLPAYLLSFSPTYLDLDCVRVERGQDGIRRTWVVVAVVVVVVGVVAVVVVEWGRREKGLIWIEFNPIWKPSDSDVTVPSLFPVWPVLEAGSRW